MLRSCSISLSRTISIVLCMVCLTTSLYSAESGDSRIFARVVHSDIRPRSVSIYLRMNPAGCKDLPTERANQTTRCYSEVWKGLYLQIFLQRAIQVKDGVFGVAVDFSKDKDARNIVLPENQPSHGISSDQIDAFHFRNSDNSGPNEGGPKNVNAPQELRNIYYPGFSVEIRLLEFDISNTGLGKTPAFGSLSFLIVVKEDAIDSK